MDDFWELFCMTGEPLAYVLFKQAEEEQQSPTA